MTCVGCETLGRLAVAAFGAIAAFGAVAPPAMARTWDVVKDFSITQNPHGVWSYTGNNTALNISTSDGQCNGWPVLTGLWCWTNNSPTGSTSIMRNLTSQAITTSSVTVPTDHIVLFASNGFVTVAWHAPAAGIYSIIGDFLSTDSWQRPHYVQIDVIGDPNPLLTANMYPYGTRVPFSLTHMLAKGQAVEFTVQGGANPFHNNTALAAQIAPSP